MRGRRRPEKRRICVRAYYGTFRLEHRVSPLANRSGAPVHTGQLAANLGQLSAKAGDRLLQRRGRDRVAACPGHLTVPMASDASGEILTGSPTTDDYG